MVVLPPRRERRRYAARSARRALVAIPALLVSLLVAGCVGLDQEGPVRQGLDVAGPTEDPLTVRPPSPEPGASPESIVRGFLQAGTANQGDMSVARSYLTDELAPTWDPDARTTIMASGTSVELAELSGSRYRVTSDVVASIDSEGRYEYANPGTTRSEKVRLERQDGEWRISHLPNDFGRWIYSTVVTRLFQPFNIYYVALGSNGFVPDVRWLPLDRQATRLTRALLLSMPDYLSGAAENYLSRVTLTVDSVPVNAGVATVDISATGLPADPAARQSIWGQLVATLTQASDVGAVNVTVEGATLSLPDVMEPVSTVDQLGMNLEPPPSEALPVLRVGRHVVPVEPSHLLNPGDDELEQRTPGLPDIPRSWNRIAESRSGEEVAAVGTDGAALARWRKDQTIEVPFFGTDLTRPAYDRHDILWVGGVGQGSTSGVRLWALNTAADPNDTARSAPIPIRAPWLRGREVVAVRVSPEGQRILVVTTDPEGGDRRIQMAGIIREPNAIPEGLSPVTRTVAPYLEGARDVTWVSPNSVAVLAKLSTDSSVRPYVVQIGGERESLADVSRPTSITTTGGVRGLAIVTDDDKVLVRAGQTWLRAPAAMDLAVPGR
jgi:hypothetical protein